MLISDHTLLLAIGFSALCVLVMFVVTWFSTSAEPFLLTWSAGTAFIVFTAFGFAIYNVGMSPWAGAIAFCALIVGIGIQFTAAIQFRTGRLSFLVTGPLMLLGVLAVANAMFSGYNGIAIMVAQGFAGFFLIASAVEYIRARAEAPKTLLIMAFLCGLTGVMLAMSCILLVAEGRYTLASPPRNWAETLGRAVTIFTIIGMGSIALVLNAWRAERRRLAEERAKPPPAVEPKPQE